MISQSSPTLYRTVHRLAALLVLPVATALAEPIEKEPTDFIRYSEPENADPKLETAIVTYRRSDGAHIDLMGVVHVGDKEYYRRLNTRLGTDYDGVLYELVGGPMPESGRPATDAAPPEMQLIKALQGMLFRVIDLSSQLENIDYQRENFIHADVTWEEWSKMQNARQESMLALLTRAFQRGDKLGEITNNSNAALGTLITKMLEDFDPILLKKTLAPMLGKAETMVEALEGDKGTAIISDRNTHALKIVDRELAAGRRKLCLFYGAGHMPGFEEGLVERGFTRENTQWETAWLIGKPDPNREKTGLLTHLMRDPDLMRSIFSLLNKAGKTQ